MKEFWKNLNKWQRWGIVGGVLLVIIIIVVAVIMILNSEPNVKINFNQNVSIPGEEIKKIRLKLANVISDNTENYNSKTEYIGSTRDYQETIGDENSSASFIVDFDTISESYKVEVSWPAVDEDVPNIIISCPLLESKYPKTACTTETNSSADLISYLPYIGTSYNGKKYKVAGDYDSDGKLYLVVQVGISENDTVLAEALKNAREWVKTLGFDASDYTFYGERGNVGTGTVNFYNQDILTSAYSVLISNVIADDLKSVILLQDADANYNATINAAEFVSYDAYTTSFEVDVSDGKKYLVIAKADSFKRDITYVYVAIAEQNSNEILIFINGDSNDQNEFSDFAKEKMGKSLVKIISSDLVI